MQLKTHTMCVCMCVCMWMYWWKNTTLAVLETRSSHGLVILRFPKQTLCYLLHTDLRGTRSGLQRNRMQFHQMARNSAVVSTAAKSHQRAAVQRNWSSLRDVCMRYYVWPPSSEYICKRENQTHTVYTEDVNIQLFIAELVSWMQRGKETSWKKISWKKGTAFGLPLPLHTLPLYAVLYWNTLCSGHRSIAGPVHHLVTHRGNFEPQINLMCCDSGTNRGRLRPNFVSGILLSRGGEEKVVLEFVVWNEICSEFCKLIWPWPLIPNI